MIAFIHVLIAEQCDPRMRVVRPSLFVMSAGISIGEKISTLMNTPEKQRTVTTDAPMGQHYMLHIIRRGHRAASAEPSGTVGAETDTGL